VQRYSISKRKEKGLLFSEIILYIMQYTVLPPGLMLHYIINHEIMPSLMCTSTPSLMTSAVML